LEYMLNVNQSAGQKMQTPWIPLLAKPNAAQRQP
jgi:hypothetical protein